MGLPRASLLRKKVESASEVDAPINELIEIGVFAPPAPNQRGFGKAIYLQKHRVRPGKQTITVMVPEKPARGGIDPYNLLDWEEGDNVEPIEIAQSGAKAGS